MLLTALRQGTKGAQINEQYGGGNKGQNKSKQAIEKKKKERRTSLQCLKLCHAKLPPYKMMQNFYRTGLAKSLWGVQSEEHADSTSKDRAGN